uniref:Ribosomal protein L34 n=1 Tax=Dasyclonium flaccidum TaxID=2007274 RepID=A0A1Z1MKX7_9FLOR|nr:ribosomal protein L34 [Dasyclonium flaccidum]ARW66529.1 ribosomal protein L34 [Dasyclonium flaccidum]
MNKGTKIKQIRKSGFLARMKKKSGQKIINSKRSKKRTKLNL